MIKLKKLIHVIEKNVDRFQSYANLEVATFRDFALFEDEQKEDRGGGGGGGGGCGRQPARCTFFCISIRSAKSVPTAEFYAELERRELRFQLGRGEKDVERRVGMGVCSTGTSGNLK